MPNVLFCLLLNDLGDFMQANGCSGKDFDVQHCKILTYLKLLILLVADDAVIFATDQTIFYIT